MTIRKESAKCMRFLIAACKEHPEKQRALFIMTYAVMMDELAKREERKEFEQINSILKELSKMLLILDGFETPIFTYDDAKTFIGRLVKVVNMIKEDKVTR